MLNIYLIVDLITKKSYNFYMKYLLILFLIGCQSKPVEKQQVITHSYKNKFWLGCINAYTYWQIKQNNPINNKFSHANQWCVNQEKLLNSVRKKNDEKRIKAKTK